jgi:hypothetical protein
MNTTATAAHRLARGFKPGDFVFFGPATVKVRVPVEGVTTGATQCRTQVRSLGRILRVTPSGLLRVEVNGRERSLTAAESKHASKIEGEALARRQACVLGWVDA